MFRISLPSLRVSAPIIHSAVARVGLSLTASTPSGNHQNDVTIKQNNKNDMLREIQETAKLVDVAGRSFVSASTCSSSFPFSYEKLRNKWSPNRFLFQQYQVFDFFTPSQLSSITSSTLFTAKRFCSSASPPSTLSVPVASDAKTTSTTIDTFWFNLAVIKHVLLVVSSDVTLMAVFEAVNRELAGPSAPQIDKNNIASRYDEVADKLNDDSSDVATKFKKGLVLNQMIDALAMFKIIAPTILGQVQQTEYSLLVGTIFFLCSFSAHKPRITVESLTNVFGLHPYRHLDKLGAMVANDIWSQNAARDSITTDLITSTFEIAQKIDENNQQHLPEIIRCINLVHNNLSQSTGLPQECKFVEHSHTKFSCSTRGKDRCSGRFVNPESGAGITSCFVCQWTPKDAKSGQEFLDNDIVNIVTGASGSGKTMSSLICGASSASPVHCMLVHTGEDCGPDIDPTLDNDKRNTAAVLRLRSGILATIMSGDEQAALAPFEPSLWWAPTSTQKTDRTNQSSTQATITSWFAPAVGRWKGVLRIVIDEIGTHPVFLRALCAVWNNARKNIAKSLGVSEEQLQLVAVGTGADNFELSKLGSIKDSYKVLNVNRDGGVFKQLFRQQIDDMNEKSHRPPALHLYKLLFCENPALKVGASDTTSLPLPTTDPVFRALLRLVTNTRCAAIILSLMHRTFVSNKEKMIQRSEWSLVQLRATVSDWCVEAVNIYCSMNALARLDSRQRHYSLGQAIAYDLNRSLCMKGVDENARENEWTRYGVRFGLLSDTAREIKEGDSTMQQVFTQTWTDSSDDEPKLHQQHFGIPFGTSRFRVDDAFVMMFLLMSGTASNDVFAKNYSNVHLLFEEAMFDFQRIAAQFGHRHPVPTAEYSRPVAPTSTTTPSASTTTIRASAPDAKVSLSEITLSDAAKAQPSTVPMTLDEHGFSPPHLLYGLGCKTVYSARLSFKLENATLTPTKKTKKLSIILPEVIQQSARMWREKVKQGDAIVLLNGDNASCADIITLARNRIIFTQCKNGSSITTENITTEICKMRHKELLGLLCWCVDTTNAKEPVEIFYVLAGGEKKAFSEDSASRKTKKTTTQGEGAKRGYFEKDRYVEFSTKNKKAKWPMMPLNLKSKTRGCTVLDSSVFGTAKQYRLHESIHFTYAYSNKMLPYSPVLKSKLPTPDKASESDYSCMQRFDYDQPDCDAPAGQMDSSCVSAPQVQCRKKKKMK